ncbi:cation-translocating P-type ATPase [Halomonas lysinitropha]|uniref:Putative cation-transporting ATPase F n=1 Tax=Halomonas lysinitropha TaxID=2607506 RepID=A0A5K1IAE0_9GAMM|nr:HAD-IC family P-type ATPase [Halomonas lysinitropha]VVZ97198.1 putative cation-transporting ATPase F [Halomonas lysinitropha]
MANRSQNGHAEWHALSTEEALKRLDSSAEGLDSREADDRLAEHGPNKLKQAESRPWWKRLMEQFNNILMLILIVAAVASQLLGHSLDAAVILAVVVIIALIGFFQEGKAERALDSIRNMLSPRAKVLRDGRRSTLDATELVPGDIVLIQSGDRVPADLRLIKSQRLRTQEAPLTGESEPVDKSSDAVDEEAPLAERSGMAHAGTLVVQGNARGLVVETGRHTQIGRISEMLQDVEKLKTPLLAQLDRAGNMLALFIVGGAAFSAAIGIFVHGKAATEMFMAAVALAVAAIPQGLPAIVTIGLAIGVQAMARRNAIIRRLPAVETLGSISTIFTDKTGTLTRNEMTARAIRLEDKEVRLSGVGFSPEGSLHEVSEEAGDEPEHEAREEKGETLKLSDHPDLEHLLLAGVLCNEAELKHEDDRWHIEGDPTEGALVVAAAKADLDASNLREAHPRLDTLPFESEYRYMATLNEIDGEKHILVKGAPDRLLEMCDRVRREGEEVALDTEAWEDHIEELSSRGLRVLAIAEKRVGDGEELDRDDVEQGLVLLGMTGLLDPPREAAIEAVKQCLEAGIRPVMITGDHPQTARAIAEKLGFAQTERAVAGRDIEEMSNEELQDCVRKVDVFARAAPEHKLRLVKAMQAQGGICAMTGDGVNDGPALKRADVGVAMGVQGTEAAKEASEMVLADDNFATIEKAIEEGRKVYDNIRKTITFLLPTNGAESLAVLLAMLGGMTLPISGLQILWVNMVTAVTLGMALVFESSEPDIMRRQPRDPDAPLLSLFMLWRVVFVSVVLVAAVAGLFFWILGQGGSLELARSGAVNMLVMGEIVYLLNSRFLVGRSLSLQGIFGSRPVLIAIGLVILIQLGWTYLPFMQLLFEAEGLSPLHWGLILATGLALFLVVELEKWILRHFNLMSGKQAPGRERASRQVS